MATSWAWGTDEMRRQFHDEVVPPNRDPTPGANFRPVAFAHLCICWSAKVGRKNKCFCQIRGSPRMSNSVTTFCDVFLESHFRIPFSYTTLQLIGKNWVANWVGKVGPQCQWGLPIQRFEGGLGEVLLPPQFNRPRSITVFRKLVWGRTFLNF